MECVYAYDREGYGDKFSDAAIIGHTTETEASLWVRVKKPGKYTLVIFNEFHKFSPNEITNKKIKSYLKDNHIHTKRQITHDFKYDTDLTHVFTLSHLSPHTTYYYAVVAAPDVSIARRWRFGYQKPRYFKTLSTHMENITFGMSSCHDPYKKAYIAGAGLWDEYYELLDEKSADFIIAGGDQVYADATSDDIWVWLNEHKECLYAEYLKDPNNLKEFCISMYRRVYRKYWYSPGLQKTYGRFPTYMIWDDHEIMDGWGSYTKKERLATLAYYWDVWGDDVDQDFFDEADAFKEILIECMWEAAQQVYIEYQHSHNPQNDNKIEQQFDYSFDKGKLGFYVLDSRGHHDYEKPDGERILGLNQFSRFKDWIESPETKNKDALFIVLTIPVHHWNSSTVNFLDFGSAKDDLRDQWEHESNYKERDKILELVFEYSSKYKKTVVFLSGDVHSAAIFQYTRDTAPAAKVFQFTTSAITRPPAPKLSEIISSDKGRFGKNAMDIETTRFKKLAFIAKYNFGLIECKKEANGKLSIWGNIYSGDRNTEINGLSRKRIKFS